MQSEHKTLTVPTVEQRYLHVAERQKLEALTRILDLELPGAALIFVGTKLGAADVAERLQARGYEVEAMHGDMNQAQRGASSGACATSGRDRRGHRRRRARA